MPLHDIVVIGGSAGALQALTVIVERLPPGLRACVLIVMHTRAESSGLLPAILGRVSTLPVKSARDGAPLTPGHIFVAPPDFHLIVDASAMRLSHGPRENGFRPAIDPLFRTAARELESRVIGVVLSGALSDGTYGLSVIKHHRGIAIVQDPTEAIIASMPQSALDAVDVDYRLPAAEIAAAIERLSLTPAKQGEHPMARTDDLEPQLASEETEVAEMQKRFGAPSPITCPDCGGALWEVREDRVLRYQCHVGHQYAPDALETEQRDAIDSALWTAVRALEEQAELKARLARRAEENGLVTVAGGFSEGARDAHGQAQQIRSLLFSAARSTVASRPRRRPARAQKRRSVRGRR